MSRTPRWLLPALRGAASIATAALLASGLAVGGATPAFADGAVASAPVFESTPPTAAATEEPASTEEPAPTDAPAATEAPAPIEDPAALEVDAAGIAAIQGTVTVSDGTAADGVSVNAYRHNGEWFEHVAGVATDAAGGYSLDGLTAGTYTLEFAPAFDSALIAEWWNDRPDQMSADSFEVADGSTISGMDAQLGLGGAVEGVVADSDGAPLPYAGVTAFSVDNGYPEWRGSSSTDESGAFAIAGLAGGTYTLQFSPPWGSAYSGEWWNDKPDQYSADTFSVVGGETVSGLFVELAVGGSISGVVTGSDDLPLAGVDVSAMGSGNWVSAVTDADGRYDLTGLGAGDYTISFRPGTFEPSLAGYLPEYWDDKQSQFEADPVTVGVGEAVTGIDAQLAPGGSISGVVAADGESIAGVEVSVSGPGWGWTTTDADGHYQVTGLAPGSYEVWFTMPSGSPYFSGSATVQVTAGGDAVLDFAPERAASVTGRVTVADSGASVPGATITMYGFGDYPRTTATTDADGYFSIAPVEAGRYLLEVSGEGIRTTWSGGSATRSGATIFSVASASETIVDVAAPAGAAGAIAGAVSTETAEGVVPAAGAVVELHTERGVLRSTVADIEGQYRFEGLEAGQYAVRFKQTEWASSSWWWDGSTREAARFFDVGADGTVTRDFTMPGLGWISSTFAVDGEYTGFIHAEVFDAGTGELVASGSEGFWTDELHVGDVPAGDVKVRFTGPIRDVWWGGGADFADAQILTVPIGGEARADVALSVDTVLSGVVYAPDGQPVAGTGVSIWPDDGSSSSIYAVTDDAGAYRVTGLEPGRYTVTASAGATGGSVHGPLVVEIGADSAEVTLDIRFSQDVRLAGTITHLGAPVEGCVSVRVVGAEHGDGTCTGADGFYEYWLQPGEHVVSFRTMVDIGAAASSHLVTVTPDQSGTIELDAELEPGGVVEGTVTADFGNGLEPVAGVWVSAVGGAGGASAVSGDDGTYRIWGLENGVPHTVQFGYAWNDLAVEWWEDASSRASATTVVPAAEPTTGIDAVLTRGGSLSGRVTDAGGLGASFTTVEAYSVDGALIGEVNANIQGAYVFTGLPAGEVKLRFTPAAQWTPGHLSEWWQDAGSAASASAVTVVGGEETSRIDAALNEVGTVPVDLDAPQVSGSPRVGETLTAVATTTTDGASLTYEWLADDVVIAGATDAAFVLTPEQLGARMSVRVTASVDGYLPTTLTSLPTDPVAAAEPDPSLPQISGTPVVGAKLEADPGEKPQGTAFLYQWYADGAPIADATDAALRLTAEHESARIEVQVTTIRRGVVLERRMSDPTLRVLLASTPDVSGARTVGSTLTVDPGAWTAGTRHAYQWYADGAAIDGATASMLELTSELVGAHVGVTVTGHLSGYPIVERSSEGSVLVRP